MGPGWVSPAELDYLLLLYLERSQDVREGEMLAFILLMKIHEAYEDQNLDVKIDQD